MAQANDRIFYACQGVGIQDHAKVANIDATEMVHGLQSVGITTNFSLEQAFELGQIEIYENIEGTPDIEVTLEKVLDGDPLIYHLATTGVTGSTEGSGLVNRSKQRCDVRLGIFPDAINNIGSHNNPAPVEVYMSGMYVSSISYSLGIDGSHTESVTLVGNNKKWFDNANGKMVALSADAFNGSDTPAGLGSDLHPSGGISQKEDVIVSGCIFPRSIFGLGLAGSGYGNAIDKIHAQSISVSTDFSREDIFELGKKTPYARPASFPIEVTCDIEVISVSGDFVQATEDGDYDLYATTASGNNTPDECIFIYTRNGLGLDLGSKNRLTSVSYGGGDAGGGNASSTYSYVTYNDLDVQMRTNGYIGFEAVKKGGGTAPHASTDAEGGPFPDNL